MSVTYICKHCGMPLGEITSPEISEYQLGFHFLTPEERRDIITYNSNGEITVKLICDYCNEALQSHPELTLAPSPLQ